MECRRFNSYDIETIEKWFCDNNTKTYVGGLLPLQEYYSRTESIKEKFKNFVYLLNDVIVGFASVECNIKKMEKYLLIIVAPEYRRKGIGQQILIDILEKNKDMDLVAYIDVHNFVSIDLFKSVGFVFEELDKQEDFCRYILKI